MKNIFKGFKILLFAFLVFILELFTVKAASNPYSKNSSYGTNCTWYAWQMAYEKAGITLPGFGNAKDWYQDAKEAGYTVGTSPKANSIIVWGGWTAYGHVGYVEKVAGNTLYVWDSTGPCIDREDPDFIACMQNSVSEDTDKECYAKANRIACEYTISPDLYGITGYIYLDYPRKSSSSSSSSKANSSKKEETPKVSKTKSSNANLSKLELSTGEIKFDPDVLTYEIKVLNDVTKIDITATLEDSKASVTGTGSFALKTGSNTFKLTVKAEDGTTKDYQITVLRAEPIENIEDSSLEESFQEPLKNNTKTLVLTLSIVFVLLLILASSFVIYRKHLKKTKQD